MKINKKKAIIAAGAAAAATMLIAPAAFASGVVIVNGTSSPAADVTVSGTLSGTISFLTDFGTPASCTTASVSGYVKRGAALATGTKVGAITNMTFGGGTLCKATGLNYPVIIAKSVKTGAPAEWPIVLTSTPAKGSASAPIVIQNVNAQMHSTNVGTWACELTATGNVPGNITQGVNPTINIVPAAGVFPLALATFDGNNTTPKTPTASTCGGQIYTGDAAQMTGTFTLSTPVTW